MRRAARKSSAPSVKNQIQTKIQKNERLTSEEGLYCLTTPDLEWVCQLADERRRQMVGDTVYYASTFHLQPTNLCELSCSFCSFYAKPGWESAWFHTPADCLKMIEEAMPLTEIHITGGMWRDVNLDYYKELFTGIKAIDKNLHIKALTAVEYDYLANLHGIDVSDVFERMMEWGLDSLPGGGAENFHEEIRPKIAAQKIDGERYLEIHGIAHRLGLPSNVTMLFGHIEEPHHIIYHLDCLRKQQDKSHGFRTFVPLRYHTENNALGKRTKRLREPPPLEQIYATARLMLDNFPNLKVLWKYVGIEMAQKLLNCGGNDLSSTYEGEVIIEMAGSLTHKMTSAKLDALITDLGRTPQKIHSGQSPCASVT